VTLFAKGATPCNAIVGDETTVAKINATADKKRTLLARGTVASQFQWALKANC
jgi:hypothetical protein